MMIAHNLCLPRSYGTSFYCYTWIVLKLSRIWLENKQLLLPLWLKKTLLWVEALFMLHGKDMTENYSLYVHHGHNNWSAKYCQGYGPSRELKIFV